jgi:hypothetical protein
MNRCDLPCAVLAVLFMLVSIPGATYAGPVEDAEEAVRKGNYATAIPIYRSLAEKGDVRAQMRLGFFYENGAGLKRDWVESVRVSVIPGRDFGKSRTRISVITGQRFR